MLVKIDIWQKVSMPDTVDKITCVEKLLGIRLDRKIRDSSKATVRGKLMQDRIEIIADAVHVEVRRIICRKRALSICGQETSPGTICICDRGRLSTCHKGILSIYARWDGFRDPTGFWNSVIEIKALI